MKKHIIRLVLGLALLAPAPLAARPLDPAVRNQILAFRDAFLNDADAALGSGTLSQDEETDLRERHRRILRTDWENLDRPGLVGQSLVQVLDQLERTMARYTNYEDGYLQLLPGTLRDACLRRSARLLLCKAGRQGYQVAGSVIALRRALPMVPLQYLAPADASAWRQRTLGRNLAAVEHVLEDEGLLGLAQAAFSVELL